MSKAEPGAILLPFRVHFEDGTKIDVSAATSVRAAEEAKRRHVGIVDKVKLIKERVDG